MKSITKLFILSLLAFSFVATGCGMIPQTDDPVKNEDGSTTTTTTYKKGGKSYVEETKTWDDGSKKESVYIEDRDGNYTEESHTDMADGTTIDETIKYDDSTRTETTDTTTTKKDGTEIVYHEEAKREGGGEGQNVKESFTATETTTFPDTNEDGKTKEVTESTGSLELNNGELVEKKSTGNTTTDYKDGSKEEITFTKTEDFTHTKDASIREESTSVKTKPDGSKEEVKKNYVEYDQNGPMSEERKNHVCYFTDTTTTQKDKSGNITSEVRVELDTQELDPSAEPARKITTTTAYAEGKATGVTVETYYPPLGKINDGMYMVETKSADGKTTLSTEAEYVFYDGEKSGSGKQTVVILKDDGTSKKAKVTYDAHGKNSLYQQYSWYDEEADVSSEFEFTNKCFVTTLQQHMTQFKKSADGKTLSIVKEGNGVSENDLTAVTGKDFDYILYDEADHADWDNFKLSFESKF